MSDEMVSNVVDVRCGVVSNGDSYAVVLSVENLSEEEFAWFVCDALQQMAVAALRYAAEDFDGSVRLITQPASETCQ